jgi:dynein heavy chain
MLKLFDNCREALIQRGKTVVGMLSDEGESYNFLEGIKVEKPVEGWMLRMDQEM